MTETVVIDPRFNGPPNSANGGYACGVVAKAIVAKAIEVTLRNPPPLGREMTLEPREQGRVALMDRAMEIASARPIERFEIELPAPVSLADAEVASAASPLRDHHPWPMCFVCGPDREGGDGIGVICGGVEGRDVVASPWQTGDSVAVEGGSVATEMIWSALDCPGGNALILSPDCRTAALGRLSAVIETEVEPGRDYVAVGWPIATEGRKHEAGSAIFSQDGELIAYAKSVWIELKGDLLGAQG